MKPNCVDLTQFYAAGRDRWVTYRMMVDRVLRDVDDGVRVCAVFYGHPAVYVTPSHDMIKEVRARGLRAHMLPGISAEDCLFADLGVDPGVNGWQSYDVTPFLVFHPRFEPSAGLVLWQMDVLGHRDYQPKQQRSNYDVLARELAKTYGWEHEVIGYYAAQYPGLDPLIDTMTVAELAAHDGMSTLYVPPVGRLAADRAMLSELGMIHERLGEPASSRS
jgi:Tetrapyrrole (Corrin/Porphyrin) Methylases